MNHNVQGIVVPILTPLNKDETLCLEALSPLISHIIEGGADGIFQVSTTGEYARLSHAERHMLAEHTMKYAKGKIATYLGVSDASTKQAVFNAKKMAELSPDYLVCSLPYYYPVKDDREIISFFEEIVNATPLPLVLYNIPITCGASITISAIKELMKIKQIVGIKDSSGDLSYFKHLIELKELRSDFAVLSGDESTMSPCARLGCDGFVPSLANVFPKLFTKYQKYIWEDKFEKADEVYAQIKRMNESNLYSGSWMSAIVWRKEALYQMGIIPAHMTKPYVALSAEDKVKVSVHIATYNKLFSERSQ